MSPLKVTRIIVTLIFLGLFITELIHICIKAFGKDSFQAINELNFDTLLAPTVTLCPGLAWKDQSPFLSYEAFMKNKFTWEEIFHPKTLSVLQNESLFHIEETYASYYGLCFTLTKLRPEKVADYSFQFVLNDSYGKFSNCQQISALALEN